jgi:hypothetical protein
MALVNQPSMAPTRKLTWATLAALVSSVAADFIVGAIPSFAGVDPAELEMLIETSVIVIATFATGWFVRERAA